MKLKGISKVEQHIEKIVLGVVFAALLAIVALQFVRSPNAVEVGGGDRVSPADIYRPLEREAQSVSSALSDPDPALPEVRRVDLVSGYTAGVAGQTAPSDRLAVAIGRSAGVEDLGGGATEVAATGPIAALPVPVPEGVVAVSRWSTLDPYFVATNERAREVAGAAQPFDLASVSVEASFGGTALRDALLSPPPGQRAIPRKLWGRGSLAVLRIDAERQAQRGDGSWGPSEPVEMPGTVPAAGVGVGEVTAAVRAALASEQAVLQPAFWPTVAGPAWVPPSEAGTGLAGGLSEADGLRTQLARVRQEIEDLRTARTGRTTDPGSARTGATPGRTTTTQPRTNPAERRLAEKEEQARALEQLLRAAEEAERQAAQTRQSSSALARSFDPLGEQTVRLWVHDVRAEPGAVYRYRLRLVMNNPIYQQTALLDASDAAQTALAESPTVTGAWSAWTDPVVVGAREYFFVSSAGESASLVGADARATVELYKVYYGHYRRSILSVDAGDPLRTTIRLPEGLYLFDTGVPASQAAQSLASVQPQAGAVGGSGSDPGFSGRTGSPGDPAGAPSRVPTALGAGLISGPTELEVDMGVWFLDAAAEPIAREDGLGRAVARVVGLFRLADGAVLGREADAPAEAAAYALASASAASGSDAMLRLDLGQGGSGVTGAPMGTDPVIDDPRGGGRVVIPDDGP